MPDSKNPTDPWVYVVVIGFIGMLVWVTIVEWGIAHRKLSDLTKATGRVKYVAQRRGTDKYHSYLVVLALQKPDLDSVRLGIGFGNNYHSAQALQEALSVGDNAIVYYDAANGVDDDDGYNYGIYQLETGNAVVYSLEQKHADASAQAVMGAILTLIVTVVAGFQWIKSQNYFDPNY